VGRLQRLGWRPRIALREGVAATYAWFLDNYDRLKNGGRVRLVTA